MRISRAQPIYSGKKGGMTRPARKPYTYLPPPYRVKCFVSQRVARLTSQRNALLTSQRIALLTEFSCGKLAQFRRSKPFSSLPRHVFGVQKFFHCLPEAVLGFKSGFTPCVTARCAVYRLFVCSQCSHFCRFAAKSTKIRKAILGFKSVFALHPKPFQRSKVLLCLIQGVFGLQKCFCAPPEAFSAFKSSFVAPLGVFCRKAEPCVHRSAVRCLRVFLRKTRTVSAKSTKIRAFCGKNHKNSCLFCAVSPFKSGFNSIQTKIIIQ